MPEPWMPVLRLSEHANGCQLTLDGLTSGRGDSLQAAAGDLITRVRAIALAVHGGGLRLSPELGAPDLRLLQFVWQLGELAARGEDIRAHVLGTAGDA
jgi:hypothetical protein